MDVDDNDDPLLEEETSLGCILYINIHIHVYTFIYFLGWLAMGEGEAGVALVRTT